MDERHSVYRGGLSAGDRQMVFAAMVPVLSFTAVLVAARMKWSRRHRAAGASR
jgi:hypothetical protein